MLLERTNRFVVSVRKGEVRIVRFFLVGALNTFVGYGIFSLLIWSGLHYSLASAIATVLGVMFNFKSTGALVFNSSDHRKIVRFVLVYVLIYIINIAGLALLLSLGMHAYGGALLLTIPLALLAYCLNSRYVFAANDQTN